MNFTVSKEALLDGLQKVQHVVSTRTTLPILSNVLITVDDGKLRLTTTDLDMGIASVVEANVTKEGSTTLPARRLASIIRELPTSEVSFQIDSDNVATITAGPYSSKIKGLMADDFPPLSHFDDAKTYHISQKMLRDALKKTSYAISDDETRYVLNGVFVSFKDAKMTMVATDGRRLAMVENDFEFPASQEAEVIIPTKAVQELLRLADNNEKEVILRLGDSQISFQIGDDLLVSKLIEGNYPNYRQVIPKEKGERVSLPREATLETVRRVSLLFRDSTSSVQLSLKGNQMNASCSLAEIGEAHETMEVKYDGPDITIAFSPEFFMAPLQNLEDDVVYLDLIDSSNPGVLRLDQSFLYVIMPMRTAPNS